ncbi:L-threonine O-3-phosphate decarboxylase [Aliiruegeria haliotis]|uniref:threonine-phosphate decarboxylase n=1 Tax=Aliiruegeria haliotis TaxID=1280846 RepID=A0A2T0RIZ9_9RHOB|nr:threonine-phosphate decarboxylase CobD [Aliiruegeria haliotis]PRY21155.1 L-threonine O-3-phosphate decarboxylase [Aliiruegeria haliotis]
MARQGRDSGQPTVRDHGGGVDAAAARWGGNREDWLDLSTGINPVPFPIPAVSAEAWTDLPDRGARERLIAAARQFWQVPETLSILPVPGASAAISRIPALFPDRQVQIPTPTYNEHAAGFRAHGWEVVEGDAPAAVRVHPNNPDGRLWSVEDVPEAGPLVVDESFCDLCPDESLLGQLADRPNTLILKSFGKFWGLAGLRLGFVIGAPGLLSALEEMIGPWAVSGPALRIGESALGDIAWASATRRRVADDTMRLDALLATAGARLEGGTTLFRLYAVDDANALQNRLARARIWSRTFPYSRQWIRLGLPGTAEGWARLETALT